VPDLKILIQDPITGALRLGAPKPPVQIDGIDLLVQIVALLFLTNGGRSIVVPGRSGGMRNLIGSNINPDDPSELFADVQMIVSMVEQTIKEEQQQTSRPPSELLQNLNLVDIVPDESSTELRVIIAVVNQEQQQAQAVVVT
jgi:hypothetical protein